MPVVGTAGHVDHGKTLLITALTGVDTDRLPEEKQRGMTIDLGFTHFLDPGGRPIGVIDVPGHERYIRNMVAGAWGMDCALLVVAADDGWMPQTETHARVLSVFGVKRIILVLNKIDLVSPAQLDMVEQDVKQRANTLFGYPIPIVRVSARTGEGIELLKATIIRELDNEFERSGPQSKEIIERLYIDRVFSLKGAGTIVAGSLRRGRIRVNDELLLFPRKEVVRVRRIQSYSRDYQEIVADESSGAVRVALNLQGISTPPVRGDCLVPYTLSNTGRERRSSGGSVEVCNECLALGCFVSPIRAQQEAEIAFGTSHQKVTLYRLKKNPSEEEPLRLVLEKAAFFVPGDRFLLIRPGGADILGWGEVLWGGKTTPKERARVVRLFQEGSPRPAPIEVEAVLKGFAFYETEFRQADSLGVPPLRRIGNYLFDPDFLEQTKGKIHDLIMRSARVTISALSRAVSLPEEAVKGIVGELKETGALLEWLQEHRAGERIGNGTDPLPRSLDGVRKGSESLAKGSGEAVSAVHAASLPARALKLYQEIQRQGERPWELQPGSGRSVREDIDLLCRVKKIVPLDESLYLATEAYLAIVRRILSGRAMGERIAIGEAKNATGLSRKYILPLLNRMERDGWVKRWGDDREIRRTWTE